MQLKDWKEKTIPELPNQRTLILGLALKGLFQLFKELKRILRQTLFMPIMAIRLVK